MLVFVLCFVVLVSFCSYENHCFPCNSSVWGLLEKVNLCFSFQFLVLAFCFCFVCFLFQDIILFWVFCLFSSFVLNHNLRLFVLLLVFCCCFLVFVALVFCYFWIFAYLSKIISQNVEIPKTPKMKNAETKTDILTRAISTVVFINSVLFSSLCFFKFYIIC